jgi:hypothetical protein
VISPLDLGEHVVHLARGERMARRRSDRRELAIRSAGRALPFPSAQLLTDPFRERETATPSRALDAIAFARYLRGSSTGA